ncbi:hypothetical protein [Streptomyces vilmorinianum]|uniref:hypothetical protein n=1 Tax=Streptomyces vilmorinianum TaxID=3051092 RepID=UPI0010FBBD41|nr:hypothetical protein [Streptomyces vilmorinianum]
MLVALFGLAFLLFEVSLCVRVRRLAHLPVWRRALPTSILCFALAASAGRAWDVTAPAEALAYPLNVATALLGLFELDRHR